MSNDSKQDDKEMSANYDSLLTPLQKQNPISHLTFKQKNSKKPFFSTINSLGKVDQSFAKHHTADNSGKKPHNIESKQGPIFKSDEVTFQNREEQRNATTVTDNPFSPEIDEGNIEALNRLRSLPRGSQVDSRIAAIQDLLREKEIFKTLISLRWPKGVVCPRCQSTNVVRRDPPPDAVDLRHYYVCLNCKGEGDPSGFDDFTGLPIKSIHALRQWILCWYLIGFCSLGQVAKVLGLSVYEVSQIASLGANLSDIPKDLSEKLGASSSSKDKKQSHKRASQEQIDTQEEYSRSSWRGEKKPGPKSK